MSITVKIFETITQSVKMAENIKSLGKKYDILSKEMRQMDRRVTRLEVYFEILEKNNRSHSHLKEIL